MWSVNPCLTCGACCAHFRVSFYWAEADPSQGGIVPQELTEDLSPFRSCMRGTNLEHPYCLALQGKIGYYARCKIYFQRPTPCKTFGIRWIHQQMIATPPELLRCNAARAAWKLPPLGYSRHYTPSKKYIFPSSVRRRGTNQHRSQIRYKLNRHRHRI